MGNIAPVPWSAEQVAAANAEQARGDIHPYTCGKRHLFPHPEDAVLRATPQGWVCDYCDYTQNWAHSFTLESK